VTVIDEADGFAVEADGFVVEALSRGPSSR